MKKSLKVPVWGVLLTFRTFLSFVGMQQRSYDLFILTLDGETSKDWRQTRQERFKRYGVGVGQSLELLFKGFGLCYRGQEGPVPASLFHKLKLKVGILLPSFAMSDKLACLPLPSAEWAPFWSLPFLTVCSEYPQTVDVFRTRMLLYVPTSLGEPTASRNKKQTTCAADVPCGRYGHFRCERYEFEEPKRSLTGGFWHLRLVHLHVWVEALCLSQAH